MLVDKMQYAYTKIHFPTVKIQKKLVGLRMLGYNFKLCRIIIIQFHPCIQDSIL